MDASLNRALNALSAAASARNRSSDRLTVALVALARGDQLTPAHIIELGNAGWMDASAKAALAECRALIERA